ncbi:hypothetical protein BKA70DRAFT_1238346 [Coprinopsis sp. MPI-PUGE-AT-0042]|nr:hypothetical protein BKA70DRAFT_1238346 [Coprinopsis sp. MPI-PUGE-AT-0042]
MVEVEGKGWRQPTRDRVLQQTSREMFSPENSPVYPGNDQVNRQTGKAREYQGQPGTAQGHPGIDQGSSLSGYLIVNKGLFYALDNYETLSFCSRDEGIHDADKSGNRTKSEPRRYGSGSAAEDERDFPGFWTVKFTGLPMQIPRPSQENSLASPGCPGEDSREVTSECPGFFPCIMI